MRHHLALPALVLLSSCGSDPAPLTPSQFFQQRAEVVCAAVSPACLVTGSACALTQTAAFTAEYQAAIASFRDFIPSNAEVCLNKVRDVYGKLSQGAVAIKAADYLAMEDVCAKVYRGTSAALGPCLTDADCLDNLICDKGYCGNAKMVSQGSQCANIGEYCPQGFYCSDTGGVWFCTAKVGALANCTQNPCLESLRCQGGVCVVQLGVGEPCATNGDCASGFCEPFAGKCADDVRFANGSAACNAMSGM
jgi:hypothetical protein